MERLVIWYFIVVFLLIIALIIISFPAASPAEDITYNPLKQLVKQRGKCTEEFKASRSGRQGVLAFFVR